jgi:[ribosomal protein S5]-alanine N-acetyltransferase
VPPKPKNQVIIRPLRPEDGEAFLAAVRRSRALHAAWIMRKAKTRGEFARYLKRFGTDLHHGHAVVHRESGGLVGIININDVVRGNLQSGTIGYYAFAPFTGRGLMHEGMLLVLKRAFGRLKLHRLEANIQPHNRASIALAKKCGFVREGFSRRMIKMHGRWRDHERWALLAEDFKGT